MARRGPRPKPALSESLTLHLGEEGRNHLERCRELLRQRDPKEEPPSRGVLIRLALRRLLLALLGERIMWDDPDDPQLTEYLALLANWPAAPGAGGAA